MNTEYFALDLVRDILFIFNRGRLIFANKVLLSYNDYHENMVTYLIFQSFERFVSIDRKQIVGLTDRFPFFEAQEEQVFLSYIDHSREGEANHIFQFRTSYNSYLSASVQFTVDSQMVYCVVQHDEEKSNLAKELQYYKIFDTYVNKKQPWMILEVTMVLTLINILEVLQKDT